LKGAKTDTAEGARWPLGALTHMGGTMPRHDPVSYRGHCSRQWPFDAVACQYRGSKLVAWDDGYQAEEQAIKKRKQRNGK